MDNTVITIPLAIQFDANNTNNFKITKEVFGNFLKLPRITELFRTGSFYIIAHMDESITFTMPLNNTMGRVLNINLDDTTADIIIFPEYIDVFNKFKEPVLSFKYIFSKYNYDEVNPDNPTYVKCLNIEKIDSAIPYIIEKSESCYK